jgi:hypothetical protein
MQCLYYLFHEASFHGIVSELWVRGPQQYLLSPLLSLLSVSQLKGLEVPLSGGRRRDNEQTQEKE